MYIIQNAMQNLLRNKGRNIMIGVIVFAIILTTVVALIINNTASAVIESYKEKFSSEVSITPDFEKLREEAMANSSGGRVAMRMPELSSELALSLTDSEYLKESIATGSISANSDTVTAIDQDDSNDSETSGGSVQEARPGGGFSMALGGIGNFRLLGDDWQDFTDGKRSLLDDGVSTMPAEDNECIISEDLAEANNIAVGDMVSFTAELSVDIPSDMDTSAFEDGGTVVINEIEYTLTEMMEGEFRASREVPVEMKVSGIYIDLNDEYENENMPQMAAMNRRNEVLTNLGTLLALRETDETGVQVSVKYYLKDPAMLADFEAEARAKGLSDSYVVSTDTSSYENIVKPVEGLKSISITFMIVVIVLGAVILLLLCSIAIRERKYEIGVLRAMGMKRAKVAAGLWMEMLAITCVCLVLGLGIGVAAAQPVSDVLLEAQVEAAEQSNNNNGFRGPGSGGVAMGGSGMVISGSGATGQPLSEMEITLQWTTVLEIILIALVLSSVAALFSISKITKYEPIKILMERN